MSPTCRHCLGKRSILTWFLSALAPLPIALPQSNTLTAGAGRVLFSHPAESDVDATLVFGVNTDVLTSDMNVVSAASCTTNAVVPVLSTLLRAFGVEAASITTIHSLMNDQPVLDAYHHTDLRKTRAASQSIIPVDTGPRSRH